MKDLPSHSRVNLAELSMLSELTLEDFQTQCVQAIASRALGQLDASSLQVSEWSSPCVVGRPAAPYKFQALSSVTRAQVLLSILSWYIIVKVRRRVLR